MYPNVNDSRKSHTNFLSMLTLLLVSEFFPEENLQNHKMYFKIITQ